jgi:FdhD protein
MRDATQRVSSLRVGSHPGPTRRQVPVEVPVAVVYDGVTHAVMMASPTDLEAFALGFTLSERVVDTPDAIRQIEIVEQAAGVEARIWLEPTHGRALVARRRAMTGPTGCGLCGVDSLDAALPALAPVTSDLILPPHAIFAALTALSPAQPVNRATSATHAAAFCDQAGRLIAVAEDVGRHNALDKLIGKLVRANADPASGFVLLTSRVSIEMVQKTAVLGCGVLVAVSAPTSLAIAAAEAAAITLIAVARGDAFEVFTHPDRLGDKGRQPAQHKDRASHAPR